MKIRPLHDRVVVKRSEEERTTASGIVIPDSATEKPDQGEVVAIGTPEDVAEIEKSYTGHFLKELLYRRTNTQDAAE